MDAAILAAALGAVRVGDCWLGDCFACRGAGTLSIRAAPAGGGDAPPAPLVIACTACGVPQTLAAAIAAGLLRPAQPLAAESVEALLAREQILAPPLLAPWLPAAGSALIHGARATGKTWLALGLAWAVATGGAFAGWGVAAPRRVVHIDGETPLAALQARLHAVVAGSGARPPHRDFARVIAADALPGGIPDLATAAGQSALEPLLDGAELIVLDDLSTLAGHADGRLGRVAGLRDWLQRRRRRGQAVIAFERTGAGLPSCAGDPALAAAFDAIAVLERPAGAGPRDAPNRGARFGLRFDKARAAARGLPPPVAVEIALCGGAVQWAIAPAPVPREARAAALRAAGWSQAQIAGALGVSQPTVSRALARLG